MTSSRTSRRRWRRCEGNIFGLLLTQSRCHRPRKRAIQYSRGERVQPRGLWNTGCPACAGHDGGGDVPQRSRGANSPGLCSFASPGNIEGAGKAGCWSHPRPRVLVEKAHELETTGSTGAIRPSLHDGVTAYTRSPRCAGLFSHRRRRLVVRQLDLSVGRPGPRDFAVRPGSLVWRPRAAIASRAQRP